MYYVAIVSTIKHLLFNQQLTQMILGYEYHPSIHMGDLYSQKWA